MARQRAAVTFWRFALALTGLDAGSTQR